MIPTEEHESSEDSLVTRVVPQSQISDPIPSQVQSTVSPTINPAAQTNTDERDWSLEDALARSRTEHLARANIQGQRQHHQSRTKRRSLQHQQNIFAMRSSDF
jgi:hypothetical protein